MFKSINNRANFNLTWHKASLGGEVNFCLNEEPRSFTRGNNCEEHFNAQKVDL